MRSLALGLLCVCTLSAANQNRLQFAPAYPVVPQGGSLTGTPLPLGTVYASQPGTSVTLSLSDSWMEFASSASACSTATTTSVTAPAAIYVCVLSGYPAATDPLTPKITATASGFPAAYDALPIFLSKPHTVSVSPLIADLSQEAQTVTLSVASGSPSGSATVSYISGSNWLSLGGGNCNSSPWQAGFCTVSANPTGLTAGQQYAALVTFRTASDSATLIVIYTYPGTSLAITSGLVLSYGQFQPVNISLGSTGGTGPYRWSASGLPPGLTISISGLISGSVDFMNTWTPQITVNDSAGHTVSETATIAEQGITFQSQLGAYTFNVGTPSPILVGYLDSSTLGVSVTVTPLFSPPPNASAPPVPVTLSGSASCPSSAPTSPTPVTVITPTPIYACLFGSVPTGTSNYSFTATALGFTPTTWSFQVSNGGINAWLLVTPPGPLPVTPQGVPVNASIENGGGTPPHVTSACVQYSASGACVPSSSSGQPGNWVTTALQNTCATSTSCTITVGANWSGQTPPTPGTTYSAAVRVADNQGDAAIVTVTYQQSLSPPVPLRFIPITPCRVVDTRNGDAFSGSALAAGSEGDYAIPSSPNISAQGCASIPNTAAAYALNLTVIPTGQLPFITMWPTGQPEPAGTSILNSYDGRIKSDAAIVPAGANGSISVKPSGNPNPVNLAIDVSGYFVPASNIAALAFFPVAPCRIVDTRPNSGYQGAGSYLHGGAAGVPFSLQSNACNVPTDAQAYSLNLTAVPRKAQLTYLTAWPTGQLPPQASTLNAPTGTLTANAAIIPAGTNGDISAYASDDTELIIDINGYFASTGPDSLSLYTLTPCRVLDTRIPQGSPPFNGPLPVAVETSTACSVPSAAQAYVFNSTVLPQSTLTYLSLLPDPLGLTAPSSSTLNAFDGSVTSNLAIVPVTNGSIDAYASNLTHVLLDIFGYFAP